MRHATSGEFSSFRVFVENFRKATDFAVHTTEETLRELREAWNGIDWRSNEQDAELRRLHRVLGIAISRLAQKDREMQRYTTKLHEEFAHHEGLLEGVRGHMGRISDEVHREKEVEYDDREISGEVRLEEERLHYALRQAAVSLRRGNQPDAEAMSAAFKVIEPTLVRIEQHERDLLGALGALLEDDRSLRRAA